MTFTRNQKNAENNRARERTREDIEKNRKQSKKSEDEKFCNANETRENNRLR